jgi:hypothetical protein
VTPPGVPVIAYGQRTSAAAVSREIIASGWARDVAYRLARDMSLCDQRSCLAPQVVFLEGASPTQTEAFAHDVGRALSDTMEDLPKGPLTVADQMVLQAWRDRYRFRSYAGGSAVIADPNLRWIVAVDDEVSLIPGPGGRTIRICPVPHLRDVVELVGRAGIVSAVGLAAPQPRRLHLATQLADAGVSRVSHIGDMLAPNGLWHQDGEVRLRRLLRWTDLEPARDWGPPW